MSKILLAYKLDTRVIGVDMDGWNDNDLNGNKPFMVINDNETIPTNYESINTIENWVKYGQPLVNDYLVLKTTIKELVVTKTWNSLTNVEKDYAIQFYSYPTIQDAVIYLMTAKGYTQEYAQFIILQQWHKHHGRLIASCKQRWYYVKLIVPMYLSFNDAEDLLDTIEPLIFVYNDMGRLGVNYGDKKDGIMDYIESTNTFFSQGLKENNYILLIGTWNDFINALKNVLVYGIYNKYPESEFN